MPMGQLCSVTIGGLRGKDEQEAVDLTCVFTVSQRKYPLDGLDSPRFHGRFEGF